MEYYIYLHSIGLTHKELFKIYHGKIDPKHFYENLDETLLRSIGRTRQEYIRQVLELKKKNNIEYIKNLLCTLNAKVIFFNDEQFPNMLNNIGNTPFLLYVRGSLELNSFNFGIVGSRHNTDYGESVIREFTPKLTNSGFCIISGGASGIDSLAHKAALSAGGKTIAVIGTGIERNYPSTNKRLFDEIIEKGGSILSCFRIGIEPDRYNFPIRNEIIAGLCRGVLIVEAGEKSGTLITAQLALEQNKEVFVIPGDIFKKSSVGANSLIRDSLGKLVTNADDILIEYGKEKITENKKQIVFDDILEENIYGIILKESTGMDGIADILNIPVEIISFRLTIMEIKKIIKLTSGGKYTIN